MAARPGILVRYDPQRTYDVHQGTYPGAQTETGRRGWWPAPAVPADFLGPDGLVLHGGHLASVTTGITRELLVRQVATGAAIAAFTHTFTGGTGLACVESDGTYLYVGGDYTAVDGVSTIAGRDVAGLVRFDYAGRLDTTWNPSPNAAATAVQVLRYNPANGTLYVAGDGLSDLNGTARTRIGEVSLGDAGNATAWAPNPDGAVTAIAVDVDGARVYLGGDFANAFGAAHVRLLRATMTGAGAADAWAPAPNGNVGAILLYAGLVYCVGAFTLIGSVPAVRNRAATVNPDGTAGDWNPDLNGTGKSLARYRELVFIGGGFTTVGGTGRDRLAVLTAAGAGTLQAWNPGANAQVGTIVLLDRTLYVGGSFGTLNGVAVTALGMVPFPIFVDATTRFVAKTGSDAAAGTAAAPYLTITKALADLASGAFSFAVVTDSGEYSESLTLNYQGSQEYGGLYTADGAAAVLERRRGALADTYGARVSGRTKFSTGAASTFIYVSKLGNNATGLRGNSSKPFLTITGALAAVGRLAGDTIQIQDSGTYVEQVAIGALSITIQAAAGQVPTLTPANLATSHISANAGVAFNLYGLNLAEPFQSAAGTTWAVNLNAAAHEIYDCSFSFHTNHLRSAAGILSTTVVVDSCLFYRATNTPIESKLAAAGSYTIRNCYFNESGTGTGVAGAIRTASAGAGSAMSFTHCTIRNPGGQAGYYANNIFAVQATQAITDCLFFSDQATPPVTAGIWLDGGGAAAIPALTITNCEFDSMGSAAIRDSASDNATNWSRTITSCLARRCGRADTGLGVRGIFNYARCSPGGGITFRHCVALSGESGGFYIGPAAATAPGTVTIDHCVSMNAGQGAAGGTGFVVDRNADLTVNITNCYEKGSVTSLGGNGGGVGVFTVSFTIISQPHFGTVTLGDGVLVGDALPVSATVDEENVALQAASQAVAAANDRRHIGIGNPLIDLTASARAATVDGLIVRGDPNFFDGVRMPFGLAHDLLLQHLTCDGLGVEGIFAASGGAVERCVLETNGFGVFAAEGAVRLVRNVAQRCQAAGYEIGAAGCRLEHLTAFQSGYGQFDQASAAAVVQRDNVYSDNGALDYQGEGLQATSDVAEISEGATVTGTRLDPLFRDAIGLDLRLQAIAAGFLTDSPAKGLAHDGTDAGAFDLYYGPLVETWTTVDLGLTTGDPLTTYRNPQVLVRKVQALKVFEGETFGGITYSEAPAFKKEYLLTWNENAAMPNAQVSDLIAIYETGDGETQISFDDGATWIPTRVLRSREFRYSELGGAPYSGDGLPTPVAELVFRESV